MNLLELKNISKNISLPGGMTLRLLENVSFNITSEEKGKITSILAPFRSGKSTLFKIIAGLEKPDTGEITFSKNEYPNDTGRIIYLPETAISFPWLSVQGNIEMALKLNKNKERMSLNEIISLIELTGYESHFPDNKSYGFRFRIALGRALAVNPLFVLADDSFRIMDPETKTEIYDLIKNICSKSEITFIAATADISEAVILSDRILLMRKNPGRIFYDYRKRDSSLKDWSDLNGFREEIQRLYRNEDLPQNMQLTI